MKLKTHKGLSKRIKFTKTGKIIKGRAFSSHLLSKKSNKRKRKFANTFIIKPADRNRVKKLLPYGQKNSN